MDYKEFKHLKQLEDRSVPYAKGFITKDGGTFYIEPVFYAKLIRFKTRYPDKFYEILDEMEVIVKHNRQVIFVGDFEAPVVEKEGFIYREIDDIAAARGIVIPDLYRGSDYGD